jgi:hypothetical protein
VLDKTIAIAILTYSNDCSNDCSNGNDSGDKLPHIQISAKVKDTVLLNGSVQLYNNTTVGTAARSNPVDCRHERPKNQVSVWGLFQWAQLPQGHTRPANQLQSAQACKAMCIASEAWFNDPLIPRLQRALCHWDDHCNTQHILYSGITTDYLAILFPGIQIPTPNDGITSSLRKFISKQSCLSW